MDVFLDNCLYVYYGKQKDQKTRFILSKFFFCFFFFKTKQCYLTKKLNDYGHIETKPLSMFIITIIYTISAWLSVLFFIIFVLKFSKFHYYERGRFRRYWPYYNYNDNDDYRLYRLLANINSWIMIIAYVMFIWSIGIRIRLFINKNYKYNDNNNNDGK